MSSSSESSSAKRGFCTLVCSCVKKPGNRKTVVALPKKVSKTLLHHGPTDRGGDGRLHAVGQAWWGITNQKRIETVCTWLIYLKKGCYSGREKGLELRSTLVVVHGGQSLFCPGKKDRTTFSVLTKEGEALPKKISVCSIPIKEILII